MNDKIERLSALEQMLHREGEQGPSLCLSGHERRFVPIGEGIREKLRIGLKVTDAEDADIFDRQNAMIRDCSRNSPCNRLCAHNATDYSPLVYDKEISELLSTNVIDKKQYDELHRQNEKAQIEIANFDRRIRDLEEKAPDQFFAKREIFEQQQQRIWDRYVNPLRKNLEIAVRQKLSELRRVV